MPDREKVIKGLECCTAYYINNDLIGHKRCPYNGRNDGDGCNKLYADALELLKEQEAVVRCKDCKHGVKSPTFRYYPNRTWCHKHSKLHNDDWFCADGERKDD